MSKFGRVFNYAMKRVGLDLSGLTFNVYRPNYAAYDQFGASVVDNPRTYRVDTQAGKFQEPPISGCEVFEVFGDRKIVQIGDVLVCTLGSTVGPTITITQLQPIKAMVGLMTDRLGQICDSLDNVIYTNVRFQFAGNSYAGAGPNEVIEESLKIPRRKIVMYRREGIGLPTPLIPGMRVVEIDNDRNNVWYIRDILSQFNYTILTVTQDE